MKALRVLTLLCFFSFSGLNNGFTYFLVSPGQVQRFDFSHALIEKSASVLNPLHWKTIFLDPLAEFAFRKPARIVEFASQRAAQKFFTESVLVQSWVLQSCGKWFSKSPQTNAVLAAQAPAVESQVQTQLAKPAREKQLVSGRAARQNIRGLQTVFEAARKESLFFKRAHFWTSHKDLAKRPDNFYIFEFAEPLFSDGVKYHDFKRLGRDGPAAQEKLRRFLTSSLSRGGGDSSVLSDARFNPKITLSSRQGDFLFAADFLKNRHSLAESSVAREVHS